MFSLKEVGNGYDYILLKWIKPAEYNERMQQSRERYCTASASTTNISNLT